MLTGQQSDKRGRIVGKRHHCSMRQSPDNSAGVITLLRAALAFPLNIVTHLNFRCRQINTHAAFSMTFTQLLIRQLTHRRITTTRQPENSDQQQIFHTSARPILMPPDSHSLFYLSTYDHLHQKFRPSLVIMASRSKIIIKRSPCHASPFC